MSDFTVISGNDHTVIVSVLDEATGDPLDLTDAVIRFKAAHSVKALQTDLVLELTTATGGIEIESDPTLGLCDLIFTPNDTLEMKGGYYYEIEVIDSTGDLSTVKAGKFTVSPSLVRTEDLP